MTPHAEQFDIGYFVNVCLAQFAHRDAATDNHEEVENTLSNCHPENAQNAKSIDEFCVGFPSLFTLCLAWNILQLCYLYP